VYNSIKTKLLRIKNKKCVNSFYSPKKQKHIQHLQSVKNNMKKKTIGAKQGIKRFKNTLIEVQNQMKNCSDTIIQQPLESAGINTNQCNLITEIFAAAKVKNPKQIQ